MVIQTTQNDVIFLGHGSYQGGGNRVGEDKFVVLPKNVDFHLMGPEGSELWSSVAYNLIWQRPIEKLTFRRNGSESDISGAFPHIYKAKDPDNNKCPNFILHDLDPESKEKLKLDYLPSVDSPHIVLVPKDTPLSDLLKRDDVLKRITDHQQNNTRLRIFWAACACQDEPSETSVVF